MEEIVLDRSGPTVMKLGPEEQALMDEISIEPPRPRQRLPPKPSVYKPPRRDDAEPMEDLDAFVNPTKQHVPKEPPPQEFDYGDDPEDDYDDVGVGGGGYGDDDEDPADRPSKGYTTIEEEKTDLMNKLIRLEKKGFNYNKRLSAYSSVEDLRNEVKRISYNIEVEQSIKFSRRALIACVTGLEFLNKKFDPFSIELNGWSESVMDGISDYDDVFERLYIKYRSKVQMAPEIQLLLMVGGSAMMFHLSASFTKNLPNMESVIKNNPDLIKNVMSAMSQQQQATAPPPSADGGGGAYEMQGPGIDLSALMGGISMPPPPMNTSVIRPEVPIEEEDDDISDIVSEAEGGDFANDSDVKEVTVKAAPKKRGGRKKKNEISL